MFMRKTLSLSIFTTSIFHFQLMRKKPVHIVWNALWDHVWKHHLAQRLLVTQSSKNGTIYNFKKKKPGHLNPLFYIKIPIPFLKAFIKLRPCLYKSPINKPSIEVLCVGPGKHLLPLGYPKWIQSDHFSHSDIHSMHSFELHLQSLNQFWYCENETTVKTIII